MFFKWRRVVHHRIILKETGWLSATTELYWTCWAISHLNDWERYVHAVCYAYNTSVQSSTGFTPHFLIFGQEARLPVDLQFGTSFSESVSPDQYVQRLQHTLNYVYQLARDTLGEVQERQKCLHNRSVHGSCTFC